MKDTNSIRTNGQGLTDVLTAALAYAEAGLLVFPVPPGTKMSYKSARYSGGARWGATRDPDQIRADWARWPNANVGIATGIKSGIFVVKTDTIAAHGVDGEATLAALERAHGPLPPTRQAVSPSGSHHIYFVHPLGCIVRNDTSRKLGPGIDVRGEGGMAVAPPSIRDDGVYRWLNESRIKNAPQWLLERVVEYPPACKVPKAKAGDDASKTLVELLLATIDPDADYHTWFAIGCACFTALGDDAGEQVWNQWSSAGRKYKPREIANIWRGIVDRDGYNHTIGTLNHFADLAAVDEKLFAELERINREALNKSYSEVINYAQRKPT
jgi:hypothetical protein